MNISKFSNETAEWKTQWDKFAKSKGEAKGERLIVREIERLNPDVIISGNLGEDLIREIHPEIQLIDRHELVFTYIATIENRPTIWLDPHHFSATRYAGGGLSDADGFYNPICRAIETAHRHLNRTLGDMWRCP